MDQTFTLWSEDAGISRTRRHMVPLPVHAALHPISALIPGFDSTAGEKLSLFERAFKNRQSFRFSLKRERAEDEPQ